MVSPNSERNGERKCSGGAPARMESFFSRFFLPRALLLPGLRPEKLGKTVPPATRKTGAAKFYGERVHKLYGLVIRCSNTLSPKHGRVPLTFFRGHQSAENCLRAIISSGRITADGTPLSGVTSAAQHLAWRKQAPRLTYSRRPFFPLTARR